MTTRYKYVLDADGDYVVYNRQTEKRLGWLRRYDNPDQPWNRDFYLMRANPPGARYRDDAVEAAVNDAYAFIAEAKAG